LSGAVGVVVMDVVLPKMSGPDALARMRALGADVPVVFVTGYSPEHARIEALIQQGAQVLHKPFSRTDLAGKVREALDRAQNGKLRARQHRPTACGLNRNTPFPGA
jgi:FixJ family two-component response regulator